MNNQIRKMINIYEQIISGNELTKDILLLSNREAEELSLGVGRFLAVLEIKWGHTSPAEIQEASNEIQRAYWRDFDLLKKVEKSYKQLREIAEKCEHHY